MTKEKRAGLASWEKLERSSALPPAGNPSGPPARADPAGGLGNAGFSVRRGSRPRGPGRRGRPEPRNESIQSGPAPPSRASLAAARRGVRAAACGPRPARPGPWTRPRGPGVGDSGRGRAAARGAPARQRRPPAPQSPPPPLFAQGGARRRHVTLAAARPRSHGWRGRCVSPRPGCGSRAAVAASARGGDPGARSSSGRPRRQSRAQRDRHGAGRDLCLGRVSCVEIAAAPRPWQPVAAPPGRARMRVP